MMRAGKRGRRILAGIAALAAVACDNMEHQDRLRPYEATNHFANGSSARVPPDHSVPSRALPSSDFLTGRRQGRLLIEAECATTFTRWVAR